MVLWNSPKTYNASTSTKKKCKIRSFWKWCTLSAKNLELTISFFDHLINSEFFTIEHNIYIVKMVIHNHQCLVRINWLRTMSEWCFVMVL